MRYKVNLVISGKEDIDLSCLLDGVIESIPTIVAHIECTGVEGVEIDEQEVCVSILPERK